MPKLTHLLTISLLLITAASAPACDPEDAPPASAEAPQFREGVSAEFESVEYATKMLADCIEVERPVTFTLVQQPPYPSGLQSFSVQLESTAPIDQVACILDVLEANQP